MDIRTQFIIKSNPYLKRYLSENSYWYKYLNRDSSSLTIMENEMKEKYKLTTKDKIETFGEKLQMISSFMDIIK